MAAIADWEVRLGEGHLVVLAHGLAGAATDLAMVGKCLKDRFSKIITLGASSYEGRTTEGVDICGQCLTTEVLKFIAEHEEKVRKGKATELTKISFIGHSMGGLISRFSVGLLREGGLFNKLEPISLITLATPHLGTRRRANNWWNPIINYSTACWPLGKTGQQLVLDDPGSLLHLLADPDQMFFQALSVFKRKTLYSNVWGDLVVPYSTAAISLFNPYKLTEQLEYHSRPLILRRTTDGIKVEPKQRNFLTTSLDDQVTKTMVKAPSAPDMPILSHSGPSQSVLTTDGGGSVEEGGEGTLRVDEKLAASVINSQHHYWSIAPSERSSVHSQFFSPDGQMDAQGEKMKSIYDSLQTLQWERYDVIFWNNPFAHEDIIAKNKQPDLVARHLAAQFLA
uniref:DUF676 domain-containing protein n=1 Tax=Paramoeba aestuarina TaxID=180227 RepID=A0A6U3BZN6_9EUKA|mmetsp:Transcript_36875/g.57950  ORF Transcript_36875/g.57950 Transcript_36875/m.57950 type:complete len:396 (+) Transcript_36875:89-1276(+)|eukprot:CAMPEP_0201516210 /NCGR_PEP_ID=MMETSP0161_2-20130828/7581_1 /ASSEMBLY_ACC=CAM_ASM_000251 /TAXON_ID=180227 /ORGANISM="Neoparamoeba aestuarina, Strain SoJaBio B1-5/56/2" /LENGTH=395 /DNA_ID=CAMNT_0047913255 /DNA_START=74 /DNA_END=1261 /DNA_ORIENTATION=-